MPPPSANVHVMNRRGTGGPNYEETFNDGARAGLDAAKRCVVGGDGRLAQRGQHSRSPATRSAASRLPDKFVMLTDVYLSWGASGNTAGVLFNYHGPGDFYEVRLNAQGTARLSQVSAAACALSSTPAPIRTRASGAVSHGLRAAMRPFKASCLQIEINGRAGVRRRVRPRWIHRPAWAGRLGRASRELEPGALRQRADRGRRLALTSLRCLAGFGTFTGNLDPSSRRKAAPGRWITLRRTDTSRSSTNQAVVDRERAGWPATSVRATRSARRIHLGVVRSRQLGRLRVRLRRLAELSRGAPQPARGPGRAGACSSLRRSSTACGAKCSERPARRARRPAVSFS